MSKELILKAESGLKNEILGKKLRHSWFPSRDGQLHVANFLLVFPGPWSRVISSRDTFSVDYVRGLSSLLP